MKRVFRYLVPLDNRWHARTLRGDVLHVDVDDPFVMEFWAESQDDAPAVKREFRVFGTGHVMPPGAIYQGTARTRGGFAWHLYEKEKGKSE